MTSSNARPVRWSQRTGPERFEAYTRWSMYAVFTLEPLMAGLMVLSTVAPDGGALAGIRTPYLYLVGACAHAVLAARLFVPAMRSYSGRGAVPWSQAWVVVGLTVVLWLLALLQFPGADAPSAAYAMLIPATAALGALSPLFGRLWSLTATSVGCVILCAGVLAALGAQTAQVIGAVSGGLLAVLGCALSFRLSAWTMRVVWELDDARAVAGRLAVAEERLRFSRDLHDVFGRTLSTVAVKSELAAALAERGDPRGPAEMLEVRQIAHDALREVRGVIQGYRSADLDTEIAGARALLASAGVECRVAGEGLALAAPVAEAASWVVRETVTNVVRHAVATRCEIDVRAHEGGCQVRVSNDGAPPGVDPRRGGSGLQGLRERLVARGGSLTVTTADGEFVVEALVPPSAELEESG